MGMTTRLLKGNGQNKPVCSHSLGYKSFKCLFLTRNIRTSHPEHLNIRTSKCHKRWEIIHQMVQDSLCQVLEIVSQKSCPGGRTENSIKCFQCILLPGKQREEPSTIPIHKHLELYQNYSFQPKATFQNNNKRSIHAEIFLRTRNTNKGDELSQMLLMYQHFSNTALFSSQIWLCNN